MKTRGEERAVKEKVRGGGKFKKIQNSGRAFEVLGRKRFRSS